MLIAQLARERLEKHTSATKDLLSLLDWMHKYRRLLAAERLFDLDSHPYLEAIYKENPQESVDMKAGQMGLSEYLLSYLLWSADQRNATGLYIMPTESVVSDFSAARLGPALEAETSPYLARLVGGQKGQRGTDQVRLKRIGNRFAYFRGGQVKPDGKAPQIKSVDADILILDEYDEMDTRVPAIARERLGHSIIAETRKVSTPTWANAGIHAEYQLSDQREWFIRCAACNEWQSLSLTNLVLEFDHLERPVTWHKDDQGAYLACLKCGGKLDRLARGEWVAAYPGRLVVGRHLSHLFSSIRRPDEIIIGLQKVDDDSRQQVFNQELGLPYSSPTAIKLDDSLLNLCKREYSLNNLPDDPKSEKIAMGIDVGNMLHVIIRAKMPGGEHRLIYAGQVSEFEDLPPLARRFKVNNLVIDALPETRKARDLIGQVGQTRVWLAYYDTSPTGKKGSDFVVFNDDENTVTISRTRSLDHLMASFSLAAAGEPGHTLSANAQDIPDYSAHLKSTERRLRRAADGNRVAVYAETGADHYLHAENYCLVAFQGGPKWKDIKFLSPGNVQK